MQIFINLFKVSNRLIPDSAFITYETDFVLFLVALGNSVLPMCCNTHTNSITQTFYMIKIQGTESKKY